MLLPTNLSGNPPVFDVVLGQSEIAGLQGMRHVAILVVIGHLCVQPALVYMVYIQYVATRMLCIEKVTGNSRCGPSFDLLALPSSPALWYWSWTAGGIDRCPPQRCWPQNQSPRQFCP